MSQKQAISPLHTFIKNTANINDLDARSEISSYIYDLLRNKKTLFPQAGTTSL